MLLNISFSRIFSPYFFKPQRLKANVFLVHDAERGREVLHNISENTRKNGGKTPTSGCGCVHPRVHPSGSRDHFRVRSEPLPITSLPVASPRSTSANANWAVPIYYSGDRSVVFFVYSGTPEEQKSIWDLLILYFFSIFFLQLIGLYILFTVHSLTLFRHCSAIDFPERNGLQRQSSVPSRSRCRCILRQ